MSIVSPSRRQTPPDAAMGIHKTINNHTMLMIRFQRIGRTKAPSYRLIVSEKTKDTQAGTLEPLGIYDPTKSPKVVELKEDRIKHWLSVGAQPSESVRNLLIAQGILSGDKAKSVKISQKRQGKISEKKAAAEEAEKAKKEAEAAAKAEAEAAAAAEAEAAAQAEAAPAEEEKTEAAPTEEASEAPAEEEKVEEPATEEAPAEAEAPAEDAEKKDS